jgi:hypothetical protein
VEGHRFVDITAGTIVIAIRQVGLCSGYALAGRSVEPFEGL